MSVESILCAVDALMDSPRTTDEIALICEVRYDTAMKYVTLLRQVGRLEFDGFAQAQGPGPRPSRWRWVRALELATTKAIAEATGVT